MTKSLRKDESAALFILKALRTKNHIAYFAGGCVRDRLLGVEPKDYDIATDATPKAVGSIFPRARKVGAQFGVMLVRKYGCDIEVATFRTDGAYSDGRRPDRVEFATAEEDARRRDFTINGLFYDPLKDQLIDFVGGRKDIQKQVLRTIGDPQERFSEDHLRLLRAVRFAARFNFVIDEETFAQIQQFAPKLSLVSAERVWLELQAILTATTRARGWKLLLESNLRSHLVSGWPSQDEFDRASLRRLNTLPNDQTLDDVLAFAAVVCDETAENIRKICKELRLSNFQAKSVRWLAEKLRYAQQPTDIELADLKFLMASDQWNNLLMLLQAWLESQGEAALPFETLRYRANRVAKNAVNPAPFVSGHDVADLGVAPGVRVGELLDKLYRAQLNEEIHSKKEALELAKRAIAQWHEND